MYCAALGGLTGHMVSFVVMISESNILGEINDISDLGVIPTI